MFMYGTTAVLFGDLKPVLSRICPEVGNPNVSEPSLLPPFSPRSLGTGSALFSSASGITLSHRHLACVVPASLWWWNFFALLKFNSSNIW